MLLTPRSLESLLYFVKQIPSLPLGSVGTSACCQYVPLSPESQPQLLLASQGLQAPTCNAGGQNVGGGDGHLGSSIYSDTKLNFAGAAHVPDVGFRAPCAHLEGQSVP